MIIFIFSHIIYIYVSYPRGKKRDSRTSKFFLKYEGARGSTREYGGVRGSTKEYEGSTREVRGEYMEYGEYGEYGSLAFSPLVISHRTAWSLLTCQEKILITCVNENSSFLRKNATKKLPDFDINLLDFRLILSKNLLVNSWFCKFGFGSPDSYAYFI